MDWKFSFGWAIIGLLIIVSGALVVYKHQFISDHFFSGSSSFDRIKLWGVIFVIIGFMVMINLHTALLTLFTKIVFKR
jgi:hypothetical protein